MCKELSGANIILTYIAIWFKIRKSEGEFMRSHRKETPSPKVTSIRVLLSEEEDGRLMELVHSSRRTISDIVREGIDIIYARENKKES